MSARDLRLWPFTLELYQRPGVPDECLVLQDRHGINVNLLLFCLYVGAVHGAVLPDAELRQAASAVEDWHDNVVSDLRKARRALKSFATEPSPIVAPAQELRTTVKAAELEAERLEQTMLEEWSVPRIGSWPRTHPSEAAAANIRALFAATGESAQRAESPHRLLAAALDAAH